MQRLTGVLLLGLLLLLGAPTVSAEALDESLEVISTTHRGAAATQQRIDQLAAETRALLEEYRRLRDGADYHAAYTRELEELERSQREQIEDLREQIARAAIIRQRIVPLMRGMADALEKFVVLDMPFHQEDRINGVLLLKRHLSQPDLSVAARFRLLLEAFQLEQGYGNSIEAWRGSLTWQGEELSVEYLRIGRVALYFQSLDGSTGGYWNATEEAWLPLDARYNRDLMQALRVARNLVAPQLLQLPMLAPGDPS